MRKGIVVAMLSLSSPAAADVSEEMYDAMWGVMLDCGKHSVIAKELNIDTKTDKGAILDWFRQKGAEPVDINALSSAWDASAETARFGENDDVNMSKLRETLDACEKATRKGRR